MRAIALVVWVMTAACLVAGCGGRQGGGANSSQQELDRRHCTTGADCASGFCGSNGRCG
ncbi:MAG TPA: hypothetical protein VHP33_38175 [Polyangiaceae bacterium]|nr:hypothetical protein [Polyangiaceae bacterium]